MARRCPNCHNELPKDWEDVARRDGNYMHSCQVRLQPPRFAWLAILVTAIVTGAASHFVRDFGYDGYERMLASGAIGAVTAYLAWYFSTRPRVVGNDRAA